MGVAYVSGVSPSILVEVGPGAGAVVDKMAKEDVHVRIGQTWGMPRYIRISFGLEDQNRAASEALGKALA
jgi:histidinol-phosphate/aromatic aminotransferase/cobyric acid decarboxylase-like protein